MKAQIRFRSLKRIVLMTIGMLLVASCEFEEPEITNFAGLKLKRIEGRHVEAEFTVDCENLNSFAFKVKRADIDVNIADQKIGTITLDEKVKVKRRSKNTYTVPVSMELENGALMRLMQLSLKNEISVNFTGKVRGSVYGFAKSFKVNETRSIDGSMLQMPQE